MSLRRAGAVTFAAALLVCVLAFVTVGPVAATTEAFCPGPRRLLEYGLTRIQAWPPTLVVTDGCNDLTLDSLFLWSGLVSLGGLALAAVGQYAGE